MGYKPGDYLAVCDRCGIHYHGSELRMEWTGLFVCGGCFNVRHPQDYVKALPEYQTVPIARPDIVASMGSTTLSSAAARSATSVVLTSVVGVSQYDPINIVLDNGAAHSTYASADPSGSTVSLGSYLPFAAASGNAVYLPAINNETYVTATEVKATGF